MAKKNNAPEEGRYRYETRPHGLVVKHDSKTNRMYAFMPRDRSKRKNYVPAHNLTLEVLKYVGAEFTIQHLRYFRFNLLNGKFSTVVGPIELRKEERYELLPTGGFTHLTVKLPMGQPTIRVTSACPKDVAFDRREGVQRALEKIGLLQQAT